MLAVVTMLSDKPHYFYCDAFVSTDPVSVERRLVS